MRQKRCFKCGETKPLSEFYQHAHMADGHLNKCKACTKRDVRHHRAENDSVREYDRRRGSRHPPGYSREWRRRNPEKYRAHIVVNNAVRDGKVQRQPCEECGEPAHAHHDDYSRPLEVRWLCPLHHQRHHAKEA